MSAVWSRFYIGCGSNSFHKAENSKQDAIEIEGVIIGNNVLAYTLVFLYSVPLFFKFSTTLRVLVIESETTWAFFQASGLASVMILCNGAVFPYLSCYTEANVEMHDSKVMFQNAQNYNFTAWKQARILKF